MNISFWNEHVILTKFSSLPCDWMLSFRQLSVQAVKYTECNVLQRKVLFQHFFINLADKQGTTHQNFLHQNTDSTSILSAPDGPHVGLMNLAIREWIHFRWVLNGKGSWTPSCRNTRINLSNTGNTMAADKPVTQLNKILPDMTLT